MAFGHDTTTDEVLAGIDLTGKRAIVTGASTGLGEETARALASRGAEVTLAVRDQAKGDAAAARIRTSNPKAKVDVATVELAAPDSVRAFAKTWLSTNTRLDLLINNAGVMACPLARTREGWEMQLATNHIGHFLLTCLLTPALRAGDKARVVNLSSAGHLLSGVDFDDPHFDRRPYDKWISYGQSKTANVLFSVELNKRLGRFGITANAVHPGGIKTELGRHLVEDDIAILMARTSTSGGFKYKTVPSGAATSVWAATSPELAGKGGLYLEDCSIGKPSAGDGGGVSGYAPYARDEDAAAKLWAFSEKMVGETFRLD